MTIATADVFVPTERDREMAALIEANYRRCVAEGLRVPAWAEWSEAIGDWNCVWDRASRNWVARSAQRPSLSTPRATPVRSESAARREQPISASELRRVSFHEAAHVVMAALAGFKVSRVEVGEPNSFGGHGVSLIDFDSDLRVSSFLRRPGHAMTRSHRVGLVHLAGAAGDALAGGRSRPGPDEARALAAVPDEQTRADL